MIAKLLTEHHLEFLSLKGGCRGCPSLHLSKCQIVGNLMPRLNFYFRLGHEKDPITCKKNFIVLSMMEDETRNGM